MHDTETLQPAVGAQVERGVRPLRAAYADPPYLGLAQEFYGHLHPEAAEYDKPETHQRLIERLSDEYDCWALSLHVPALRTILNMCPDDVRVMAWVKGFASFKPGNKQAQWAWEPVIVRGGRPQGKRVHCVRDWVQESAALQKSLRGAKPERFCFWLFEVLNLEPTDTFDDIFPGSGAVSAAWQKWKARTEPLQHGLFQGPNVELSGPRRQDARPGLAKMYRVPPARAWWPAVGAPLERRVRPRWSTTHTRGCQLSMLNVCCPVNATLSQRAAQN